MTKPQSAALGRGMRHIEETVFRALTTDGADLRGHYFSWHDCSSAIRHTDARQLGLHLRDGRVFIHRFSIEEIEHASNGIIDLSTLEGVHRFEQAACPPPKIPRPESIDEGTRADSSGLLSSHIRQAIHAEKRKRDESPATRE